MKNEFAALLSGTLFGMGLAWSQMIDPAKVQGFLDLAGNWDPSLAFVMMGALVPAFAGFKWIFKHPKPLWADRFHTSSLKQIDKPLLLGSALFGLGWGMTGYCPGPSVAAMGLGSGEALLMVISIYAGFYCQKKVFSEKN